MKLSDLSLSDDLYHHEKEEDNPAKLALIAAKKISIPASTICIEEPTVETGVDGKQDKGE